MQFGSDNKVILETLNATEARAYLSFLSNERERHKVEIAFCESAIRYAMSRFGHDTEGEILATSYGEFYKSAIKRHQEDIDDTDVLVRKVKERFNL